MSINAKEFGVQEGIDNTTKLQDALDAAASYKEKLEIDGGTYDVTGTLSAGAITIDAPGATIQHKPTSDVDCLVITGLDAGRTRINGLKLKGYRNSDPLVPQIGRDLLVVRKGDYVVLEDVTLDTAKRDALSVLPLTRFYWVENMLLMNVKVQSPGQDAFHFEVSGAVTNTFVNQVTMINCESRSAVRHALALMNDAVDSAQKISNFRIINSELAGAPGSDALVRISGSLNGNGFIENITIEDTAIEETDKKRTGAGIEITGNVSGLLKVDNSIIFGTASKIVGHELFDHYHIRDLASEAYVPLLTSHEGIMKKIRTASLAAGASEDVFPLVAGEELEGTVFDRYNSGNNSTWYAKFITYGQNVHVIHAANVDVTVVNGQLRITNKYGTTPLEVFLKRTVRDTGN